MCGHAVIALEHYAIDYKLVKPVSPETQVKIQCPCGLVTAHVEYDAKTGKTGHTRFESVPAFAFAVNQTIQVGESQPNVHVLANPTCKYMLHDYLQLYVFTHF